MGKAGVIVGMASEAACLAPLGPSLLIACSGARPALARIRAEALLDAGATGLLSFGIAGALSPDFTPGTLLLPKAVVMPGMGPGMKWMVDAVWHDRVLQLAVMSGLKLMPDLTIAGSDAAITCVKDKNALAQTTGADAVDMESHIVAAVASERGVPFLVLRAIADPAKRAIPAPALVGLGPDGETTAGAVALRLLTAPWTLPALLRLAIDSRAGLKSLTEAVRLLGPAAFLSGRF